MSLPKRIRIKDIAVKAGVSTGTVDRVLHDRGHVSPDAREKVLKVLEELNYQPNIIASTLAYNRILRLAAIIPAFEKDPFWQQPKQGIDLALQAVQHYGITLDFFTFDDSDTTDFDQKTRKVLTGKYDGVLLAPVLRVEGFLFMNELSHKGIPYVQINTFVPREDKACLCYVGQDSYQSGMLAAKLLNNSLQEGDAVAILHLEKKVINALHLQDKERGFSDYFAQENQRGLEILRFNFDSFEDGAKLNAFITQILENHPRLRGIFLTTSRMYLIAPIFEAIKRSDVVLVGFDLVEQNLHYLNMGRIHFLINQNPFKQGYLGILNLFQHLILKKPVNSEQFLPLDIVVPENLRYYLDEEVTLKTIV